MPFELKNNDVVYNAPIPETPSDIKYKALTNDIIELNNNINSNNELIEELYSRKFNQTSSYQMIAEIPNSIITMLTEIRDLLANGVMGQINMVQGRVNGVIGSIQVLSSGNLFNESLAIIGDMILQQVVDSIMPIMDVPLQLGMPPLPLLQEIPKMLNMFSKLGEAVDRLPPEVKAKIEKDRENNKTSMKDKFKLPPKVKNTFNDIVNSIKQAVQEWKDFINNFYAECFIALLNLLDTVFQFFGITPGFPLNLIDMVKQAGKQIYEFSKNAAKIMWDMLVDKAMVPINAIKYLANADISSDYLISSLMSENIVSETQISADNVNKDIIILEKEMDNIQENIDYYKDVQIKSKDEDELQEASEYIPYLYGILDDVSNKKIQAEDSLRSFSEISSSIISNLKSQISIKQPPPGV